MIHMGHFHMLRSIPWVFLSDPLAWPIALQNVPRPHCQSVLSAGLPMTRCPRSTKKTYQIKQTDAETLMMIDQVALLWCHLRSNAPKPSCACSGSSWDQKVWAPFGVKVQFFGVRDMSHSLIFGEKPLSALFLPTTVTLHLNSSPNRTFNEAPPSRRHPGIRDPFSKNNVWDVKNHLWYRPPC